MPQMLVIQPAAPQAPPQNPSAGSKGSKEQNQFSPHLDNAISSKKQQQSAARGKSDQTKSPSTDHTQSTDEKSQSLEPQKSDDNYDSLATAAAKEQVAVTEGTPEITNLVAPLDTRAVAPLDTKETLKTVTNSESSHIQLVEPSNNLLQNKSANTGNEPSKPEKTPDLSLTKPELPSAITEPLALNAMRPFAGGKQDALISQLQQIIDNSSETGIVSITKAANNFIPNPNSIRANIYGVIATSISGESKPIPVSTNAETSELNFSGLLVADAEGVENSVRKSMQQSTGLRHDSQQQYFNAKINTKNLAENNQNSQENKQGDEFSKQTTSSISLSGPFSTGEQTNTFSQISAIVQDTTTQPSIESAKPIILPSGTIVHEDEIIQQVAERFQLSRKDMDSRINLKLHPAELGELKIDLTVKEGSIRANIVAQSQHSLEILEKNIQKLKTVLENLGFTIDQISITAESDSVGEFDLFDRQLFSQSDYTPTAHKERRENDVDFTLDDNAYTAQSTSTGVNVKI